MPLAFVIAMGALALSVIALRYTVLETRRQLRAHADLMAEETRIGIDRLIERCGSTHSEITAHEPLREAAAAVEYEFRKACADLDCLGTPELARKLVVFARLRCRAEALAERLDPGAAAPYFAEETRTGRAYLH
jgi:hypothetical protein